MSVEVMEVESPTQPASTYDWLASLPLASSAGSAVYSWYEGSKKCCRLSEFAIGTVESSVKYAAGTAAPIVKKLDRPIQAVDAFTVHQLLKLEEKVPAIKKQPSEVMEMLQEGRDAVYTRLSNGKQTVYTQISDGKQAISTRLNSGKEAVASTIASGKDALYTRLQSGSEALASTRAGAMVGYGVDRTLSATENVVDYLLPSEENEDELLSESEKTEKTEEPTLYVPRTRQTKGEAEEEEKEEEGEVENPSRFSRVKTISRKVKLRVYYRSLRRLHTVQQQCKSALEQLKLHIDLLKVAQTAREGVDKQYHQLQNTIKELKVKLNTLIHQQAGKDDEKISWLPEESGEEDDEIQWLTPKPKGPVQAALDYAKQLSERVYTAFQSVSRATNLLPHPMKGGASQAYSYAQELYTTLKSAKVPSDLPASALNRISEVIDTQFGYCKQLGKYITTALQRRTLRKSAAPTTEDDSNTSGNSSEEEEEEEEDLTADPSTSQPPGQGQPPSDMDSSSEGEDDKAN